MRTDNILETIIAKKKQEVALRKKAIPASLLQLSPRFSLPCLPFAEIFCKTDKPNIIAEFKRKSPSLGWIQKDADVAEITRGYKKNGAAALSVLTDVKFFGGSLHDLEIATRNGIPVLRKDFIIDEYQVVESRSSGADAILLIAACLSVQAVKHLATSAKHFGLNVLLEIHEESELDALCDEIDVVGINNRNLKTFKVDLENSFRLAEKIRNKPLIAESGIRDGETIRSMMQHGFSGFLMGEYFMKSTDPALTLKRLLHEFKN